MTIAVAEPDVKVDAKTDPVSDVKTDTKAEPATHDPAVVADVKTETVKTVPDTYTLTTPEGFDGDLTGFLAEAKAIGMTQAQAQQSLDLRVAQMAETLATVRQTFLDEAAAHAEIGGDKLEAAQLRGRKVLDRFLASGTPDGDRFRQDMNASGWGNYAPLVLLLARIGEALVEDGPAGGIGGGGTGGGEIKPTKDVLFGGSKK